MSFVVYFIQFAFLYFLIGFTIDYLEGRFTNPEKFVKKYLKNRFFVAFLLLMRTKDEADS